VDSIKNILVPIDFSADSFRALEYAIEITKKTNAMLYIVHAYRLINPENLENQSKGAALKKQLEDSLNLKFRDVEYEYLASHPIDYELTLEVGFAVDVIQSMISDKEIDLVAMGARGKIEQEELFGSTTWSVIKTANCPVMVIPKETNLLDIKHMILANEDDRVGDLNLFKVVKELAKSFQPEILVFKERVDSESADNGAWYKDVFKNLNVKDLRYEKDKFVAGIKDQIMHCKSDLLVLMPRENVFLESYFRRGSLKEIVIDTKIPLLVIQKSLLAEG
jgi:nucleotide-binding universal stress UspA family protein